MGGIDGSRSKHGYEYAPEWQTALTEGDYVLAVSFKDGFEKEASFTVTSGARRELTVEPGMEKTKTK
jgi:hypothetical protein